MTTFAPVKSFDELKDWLDKLPNPQAPGTPAMICGQTGGEYTELLSDGLARPGDEIVVEERVAADMMRQIKNMVTSPEIPVYWRVPLEWEVRALGSEDWIRVAAYCRIAVGKPPSMLKEIRARGWMVACHNDYKWHGTLMTFWLFTHPNGQWVKGEGVTDEEALVNAMALMRHRL